MPPINSIASNLKSRSVLCLLFFFVVGLPIAFPVYQFFKTSGYLFYVNAYDEPTYLSYEASLYIRGIRPSQYLVSLFHDIGISGGSINFLFDLVCVGITLYFIRKIFIELGFGENDASIGTFFVFTLPVFFGMSNPWYSPVFNANLSSGTIYWIALPEAFYPAFYRTPEPQFSWMLVSIVSYFCLKRKIFLPLYFVIPFLSEFVRIPILFVVLCLHASMFNVKRKIIEFKYAQILIGFVVFVAISLLILIYYKLMMEGTSLDDYVIQTHLPLISGSSFIALLLVLFGKRFLSDDLRRFAYFAAIASLAALNIQVISGFIVTPTNFEQYYGVIIIAFLAALVTLSIKSLSGLKYSLVAAGIVLMILYAKTIFQIHAHSIYTEKLPEELILNLKEHSSRVVLEDINVASTLGMVLPHQRLTALSYPQSFDFAAEEYFDNYLCVKEKLNSGKGVYGRYRKIIETLDHAYKYKNTDFVLLHYNRKTHFNVFFDPNKKPKNCNESPLIFYPENNMQSSMN